MDVIRIKMGSYWSRVSPASSERPHKRQKWTHDTGRRPREDGRQKSEGSVYKPRTARGPGSHQLLEEPGRVLL